uniref:Uncharacterized protein n=1 Tax=Nothobranchius furzeri TaxID=105023 RepID=A0A8C6PZ58_NOTFU
MDAGNSFPILNDDLEPGKAGVCPGSDGHISQIPGLSPTIRSLPEEKARGRRVGVQESDSDYVKLAKQGGHKGLLWHDGTITSKLTSYKTPDWFSNESGDSNKQSHPFTLRPANTKERNYSDQHLTHLLSSCIAGNSTAMFIGVIGKKKERKFLPQ